MRKFTPSISGIKTETIIQFLIDNLNNVSASINSILTQVRSNANFNSANATLIAGNTSLITNAAINAWTTAARPTSTENANVIGINTTTGNLNYTTDNGTTWLNYDGTAA